MIPVGILVQETGFEYHLEICFLLLAGCDISNRDNNLSESLVYFINEGENNLVLYNTGEDFMYTMPIFKSGLLNEEANVALSVDSKLIDSFHFFQS